MSNQELIDRFIKYLAIERRYSDETVKAYLFDLKKFEWNKINENQYISKFEEKLMIELPAENYDHSFSILKVEWTKELYELLLKQ